MINKPTPNQLPSFLDLKLTREVEGDPRYLAIKSLLQADRKVLWEKSTHVVARIPLTSQLGDCLRLLNGQRQLEQGVERIEKILQKEQKGLMALQKKEGTASSERVSRLFLITNDGAERFYRACEKIALRHRERLLLVYIDISSVQLTQTLKGDPTRILKAVLVTDREAVSKILFSLIESTTES